MSDDIEELQAQARKLRNRVATTLDIIRRQHIPEFAANKRAVAMRPVYQLKRKIRDINARISDLGG